MLNKLPPHMVEDIINSLPVDKLLLFSLSDNGLFAMLAIKKLFESIFINKPSSLNSKSNTDPNKLNRLVIGSRDIIFFQSRIQILTKKINININDFSISDFRNPNKINSIIYQRYNKTILKLNPRILKSLKINVLNDKRCRLNLDKILTYSLNVIFDNNMDYSQLKIIKLNNYKLSIEHLNASHNKNNNNDRISQDHDNKTKNKFNYNKSINHTHFYYGGNDSINHCFSNLKSLVSTDFSFNRISYNF
ncbi:uncharacterized protein ASCRUDRAFT_69490 [Ascoidea rubescens DSM 1968]|uniref:F-box domain-containing protein n=1 Tax=Ascoidea rubescens DSM 1968 TaxID=1344418 RepID=A0A1D2VJG0_9ASCO|nr:hypothetical protein ASCRUDRAFT_69490 [Ascoidea rubescens DSM 1968]ODV61751.1 hypothetical protein ASCRUDRAFT_69490 [Ascoidea rubescens DSM 1968]